MALPCDKCGTIDFTFQGKEFTLSLACPGCHLVMCWECAGRVMVDGLTAICCYNCRSTALCEPEKWDDRFPLPQSNRGDGDGHS